jgi:hypothetical protein
MTPASCAGVLCPFHLLKTCGFGRRRSSDSNVYKSVLIDLVVVVDLPEINQDRTRHSLFHCIELEGSELLPLGDDYDGASAPSAQE